MPSFIHQSQCFQCGADAFTFFFFELLLFIYIECTQIEGHNVQLIAIIMQHATFTTWKEGKMKNLCAIFKKLVQITTKNQSQSRQTIQAEPAQCYCDGDHDQDKFQYV
jgi:hypothetical protein